MSQSLGSGDSDVTTTSVMVSFAAFVIVVAGLKVAAPILAEFLLALFISVVCVPPIKWLSSKKIPQGISILIVLTTVLAFLGFVGYLVGDSIQLSSIRIWGGHFNGFLTKVYRLKDLS